MLFLCSKCGKRIETERIPQECSCGASSWLVQDIGAGSFGKLPNAGRTDLASAAPKEDGIKNSRKEPPRQLSFLQG